MSSSESVVRERVAKWLPVLLTGSAVKDKFHAGSAFVQIDIRPGIPGDLKKGIAVLEQRLVAAVNAAQDSQARIDVEVGPEEELGSFAVALVLGDKREAGPDEGCTRP